MLIRFHIKNSHPGHPRFDRVLTVDCPPELAPTESKVINWVKGQQPYLIEGEKWECIKTENINGSTSY